MDSQRKGDIALALLKSSLIIPGQVIREPEFIANLAKKAEDQVGIGHEEAVEFATTVYREIIQHALYSE